MKTLKEEAFRNINERFNFDFCNLKTSFIQIKIIINNKTFFYNIIYSLLQILLYLFILFEFLSVY
ncbi:hypothetical protein HERIO_126 [Hepatospora eriocheir]|uniref:Uncharacterized protein n=1 Tax=Hepatospora eriocheir TaxID=1081669 RepID=A0A1X0QE18_9MICR|nr:hypothetical protein HERIO_126 [Hepatospora eriocheir]